MIDAVFLFFFMSQYVEHRHTKVVEIDKNCLTKMEKYGNLYIYEREQQLKGEINMLNDEICKLRDKLNKSIEDGEDYSVIYKLSVELDELIANFYSGDNEIDK